MGEEPLTYIYLAYQKGMHANNHLIPNFSPSMRHLRYCKPSFINPKLLEDQSISLEKLLEDEAAIMAFHFDAKYFDDCTVIQGDMHDIGH